MNVIDHAILIPASPAFIWRFLGDITQNPTWQEDCVNVSFLTTQHEGKGTRWRYTTHKDNDIIVEITAWYDTLGYEYVIVDGTAVGENKGRIRLQEIAEGTLVQWTFNYELQGMLSGLRNSLGLKRSLTNLITDSLRNLYKVVQSETGGISTHEAKALLKEAPGVDERSAYEPRHPSNFREDGTNLIDSEPAYPSEQSISYDLKQERIPEPSVAEDDTKPNPVVQGTEGLSAEPSFLNSIIEPPIAEDDTQPNPSVSEEPAPSSDRVHPISPHLRETVETESASQLDESSEQSSDIRDTSTVSVFDLFGLQKPSTTEEMRAISDAELAQATAKETEIVDPTQDEPEASTENIDEDELDIDTPDGDVNDEQVEFHHQTDNDGKDSPSPSDKIDGLRSQLRRKIRLRHKK